MDKIDTIDDWNSEHMIDIESMESGDDVMTRLTLYTDGSKIGEETGYCAILLSNDQKGNINGKRPA